MYLTVNKVTFYYSFQNILLRKEVYTFNEVTCSIGVMVMKQLKAKDTYCNDALGFLSVSNAIIFVIN